MPLGLIHLFSFRPHVILSARHLDLKTFPLRLVYEHNRETELSRVVRHGPVEASYSEVSCQRLFGLHLMHSESMLHIPNFPYPRDYNA